MTITEHVVYKIRNKRTGLFSAGGTEPKWTKLGKAWSGRGPLLSHLAQFRTGSWRGKVIAIPSEWEVVPFLVTSSWAEGETVNAREMYARSRNE